MRLDAQLRQQVVDACLTLADRGYLAGTGGNVSLRMDDRHLAITPSGSDYYDLTADDICIVDIRTLKVEAGDSRPSVETALHAELLRFRGDAGAGVHTHQPLASAVALLGVELAVDEEEARRLLGPRIGAVPYAPSGTRLLVRALRRRLNASVNAYLLRNHGLICCGATMADAIAAAEQAERESRRFLREAIGRASNSELALESMEELR